MGSFGADTGRYAVHQPWAARIARDADLGAQRHGGDMRLSVFHYPLEGWTDAVVMNVLMGVATVVQLGELSRVSYAPLAEAFREIAPRERRHAELGHEGLAQIAATEDGRAAARSAIAYWRPRVAETFGSEASDRFDRLRRYGLRHRPNDALKADWAADIDARLAALNLS